MIENRNTIKFGMIMFLFVSFFLSFPNNKEE